MPIMLSKIPEKMFSENKHPEPSKVQKNLNVWNFSPFGPLGPHQDKTERFPTKQNGKPLLFPWQLAHVSNEHRYGIIGQLFADFSRN